MSSPTQPDAYDRFIEELVKWFWSPDILRVNWAGLIDFTLLFASIYGTMRFFDWLFT